MMRLAVAASARSIIRPRCAVRRARCREDGAVESRRARGRRHNGLCSLPQELMAVRPDF